MISATTAIIIFVSAVIVTGLFLYLQYLKNFNRQLDAHQTYCDNFLPQYTQGYSRHVVKDEKVVGDRTVFELVPTDKNYKKLPKVEPVFIPIENNKIVRSPKGALSKEATIIWLLPPTVDDIPQGLKNSAQGKMIATYIEDKNLENTTEKVITSRLEATERILEKVKGGDLFDEYMSLTEKLNKDLLRKITTPKTENKFGNLGTREDNQ